jgi:plasmid stabilization system protein ParE
MMKIIWSHLSVEKIEEIASYIREDSVNASIVWVKAVFSKIERLKRCPKSGRIVPEIEREDIREVIYRNYRIIYRADKNRLVILTVRHGKQLLPVDDVKQESRL